MIKYKRSWQENLVFLVDIVIVALCYAAAFFIRFDGIPPAEYFAIMKGMLPLVIGARLAGIIYFKVHKSIWQYASVQDLIQIIKAVSFSSIVIVAGGMMIFNGHPRSIFIIDWMLLVLGLNGIRFMIRLTRPIRWQGKDKQRRRKRILVVGAGDMGEMIVREIVYGNEYHRSYEVIGMVDDDTRKIGRRIHGIPVMGKIQDIPYLVDKKSIHDIIIAIPTLSSEQTRYLVEQCMKSGAKYRIVPNITDVIQGRLKMRDLREVSLEDLLGREEITLHPEKIGNYITGKNILITGAGGSIGAELCRQVARYAPKKLILLERSENALFYIELELRQIFQQLDIVPCIGDITDRNRVRGIFHRQRPDIIFHAAAHKHVPLMEHNSREAIKNNVFGTQILAEEAIRARAGKFIMLSTDKAVEPVNVMGSSKKIAEEYISSLGMRNDTKFMAVRFGNVLGSEGSVVDVFKRQIAKGGPLTVTHPEIKRYFMTIPEAAGLVLEAGFMGTGGEIFILEMGRQIKIIDLARDMIRLSGREPYRDIDIEYTDLRRGEKMFEELVASNERLLKTKHEKILVIQSEARQGNIFAQIEDLRKVIETLSYKNLRAKLKEITPTFLKDDIPQETLGYEPEKEKKDTVIAS